MLCFIKIINIINNRAAFYKQGTRMFFFLINSYFFRLYRLRFSLWNRLCILLVSSDMLFCYNLVFFYVIFFMISFFGKIR